MLDMKTIYRILIILFFGLVLPSEVFAQAAENNLTSGMLNTYRGVMTGVANSIVVLAAGTFYALATIEMMYTVGMKAFGNADIGDLLRSFFKRLLFIGFWGWMLTNGINIVGWIIDTMVVFARTAAYPTTAANPYPPSPVLGGGTTSAGVLNPDNIIDKGIQIVVDTIGILPTGISELPTALAMLVAAVFVFVAMMVIAAYMALALLEVYIVGYGAVFLLALGANRHTNGYAQAYLRYLMAVGIKVYAIALIAAVAEVIMDEQITNMVANNAGQIWATVAMAGVLMILASKAPDAIMGAIQGITNSTSPVTASGFIKGAAAVAAGGAGVGAAAVATAAVGASSGAAAASAAKSEGASGGGAALRGLAGGMTGAAAAVGGAAIQGAKEAIGGMQNGSPFPRGGTAGGRMASRIAEQSKK